jgi:transcriptional regulator with XRE-family HTH domain
MQQPELGRKIVELRKAKGLTQEELVEKCKLNVRTLQRIEAGEVTPRSYTIKMIFNALDYGWNNSIEIAQEKSGNAGFLLSSRLEQFYRYSIDLFNLKTNTMKKLSVLAFFMATFLLLAFTLTVHSQSKSTKLNPLAGRWKLVGITVEPSNANDPAYERRKIKIDPSGTRFLDLRSDLKFETRTISNDIYNAGAYAIPNDSCFVTVHAGPTGELAATANLYRYKITGDTLHFTGFYLNRAPSIGENFYVRTLIDEWWIRVKK